MDFQAQAHQHTQIRDALFAAISERQAINSDALRSDRLCDTGCWLHGQAAKHWAGSHAFLGLLETHRTFHRQAASIADLINREQWSDARKALRNGSPFALALADLNGALRRMRAAATTLVA